MPEYSKRRRAQRFGLTPEEQDAKLVAQKYRCGACGDRLKPGKLTALDHDHETMQIRDFLCCWCNVAIGMLKDSPQRAEKLAVYLRRHAPTLPAVK